MLDERTHTIIHLEHHIDQHDLELEERAAKLVYYHVFCRLTGKHLPLLADVVSGFKSFSEAPRLARKCGTHKSGSPVSAM
jgi:hypothetical protein